MTHSTRLLRVILSKRRAQRGARRRMKIVRIIARLNIGGPARNAVLLSQAFSGTVLVCGEVDKSEGDMMYLAHEKAIQPIVIKELGREISWKDDWVALWKIYRVICREKPDIIHTHTAKAGALGRIVGILYGKAVLIHTFHGHVFNGYFSKAKTVFFIWVERILALFTDRVITVSQHLKDELVYKYRIAPEEKIEVIELGFELDELLRLSLRENSEVVNIGIVGRLVPVKNHKMLFRVIEKLTAYSLKLKAVIIGDGEMRDELERYSRELDIQDMVEFKGWVKDLKAIYEGLDIVALASLNEGTPVSIIEAMAAAKPVVATKVGGVSNVVRDKENGYLVASNDEEVFRDRLLDLIEDPEKRKRFGEHGRESVRRRFLLDKLIRDVEGLYTSLLNGDG